MSEPINEMNKRKNGRKTYSSVCVDFIQNDVFVGKLLVEGQLAGMEAQVGAVDGLTVVACVVKLLVCGVHEYTLGKKR